MFDASTTEPGLTVQTTSSVNQGIKSYLYRLTGDSFGRPRRFLLKCRLFQAHVLLVLAYLSCACAQSTAYSDNTSPLRICTASLGNFGLLCGGGPPELREKQPAGFGDRGGRCSGGRSFCGHDVEVWSEVARRLGLVEHRDFERVCLGERGFEYMLSSLAGENVTYGICDIGVSAITASSDREDRGITFSRATHRSSLAIMVHAPLKQRGSWAFFNPLHMRVWIALAATVLVTPVIVFFFEAVFNKCTVYLKDGKLDILRGLRECMWHSVCHTLHIDIFRVCSFSARIVTVAYGFLTHIVTHTYTANLAAFLTLAQWDTSIRSVLDLRGKAVATIAPYVNRLDLNHHISASTADGWDYEAMIAKLRRGDYAAIISDDTQLIPRAYNDPSCSLHILPETVEPFDLAFAFRRGFPNATMSAAVSSALLDMQEDGTLTMIAEAHTPPEPWCLSQVTEPSETSQVQIGSLWGLWIIMAAAIGVAIVSGLAEYFVKLRLQHKDADAMRRRLTGMISSKARNHAALDKAAAAAVGAVCGPAATDTSFVPGAEPTVGAPCADPSRTLYRLGHASQGSVAGAGGSRQRARQRPPFGLSVLASSSLGSLSSSAQQSTTVVCGDTEDGSGAPPPLRMQSIPANSDPSADNSSLEGSRHGTEARDAAIVLPPAPLLEPGMATGFAQHAQHVSEGGVASQSSGHAQAQVQSELAEVTSMLRMVTERVLELQRSQHAPV